MSPADAQWRWFLQRAAQRRLAAREESTPPVNITVVVKNDDERPRETARVRHVLPSPG